MSETLPVTVVGLNDEQELIAAMRKYRGLRTYPTAHDTHQRHLHQICLSLHERGLVKGRERGSTWEWEAA